MSFSSNEISKPFRFQENILSQGTGKGMFAPAWVSERIKKSVAPVKTLLRDLYKNIKNSGDQFPGFWLSHLSVLLISWDDIIERFIWNIISSMCQFYHICFSNLSCQLMPVGTAEGCDTEKQPLSQNSNFYDPGWELSLFIYLFYGTKLHLHSTYTLFS